MRSLAGSVEVPFASVHVAPSSVDTNIPSPAAPTYSRPLGARVTVLTPDAPHGPETATGAAIPLFLKSPKPFVARTSPAAFRTAVFAPTYVEYFCVHVTPSSVEIQTPSDIAATRTPVAEVEKAFTVFGPIPPGNAIVV